MRVFIIYGKDGFGGERVDKVFDKLEAAVDYVIYNIFGSNEHYTSQTRAENRQSALEYIYEYTVEST